jgi:hypothetical protein
MAEFGLPDEEFLFPQKSARETFLKDLNIDPENPTQSIINIEKVKFNVDKFLHDHFRYTRLDDLQVELTSLLKELDQELYDMVNNDYFDFINLGKTLEGGEGLVDRLRLDVSKYRKKLMDENKRLDESREFVKQSLDNLKQLQELKVSVYIL